MSFSPLGLTPLIGVFDMTKSLAFYRDLLGFEVISASPEVETLEGRFSHWMWLRFGAADLMLNTQYDSNERPERPVESKTHGDTCFYIGCADVDVAYEQLTRRGLKADPPAMARYGLKLFSVKDPDGYTLVFQEVR
jgi:glyoxylase I family protein